MRIHMKAMRGMTDVERRDEAKAEYTHARVEMKKAGTKAEVERIATETKLRIRALYEGSSHEQHDCQLLIEAIDCISSIRILHDLQN